MKILQVINAFYPPFSGGGAAIVAHNISKALVRKGHKVTVYTTNVLGRNELFCLEHNPTLYKGIEIYYFKNRIYTSSPYTHFSGELIGALKKHISSYDVVHLHEYRSYISIVTNYHAQKNRIPYILQAHGQLPTITGKWIVKQVFDILFGCRLLLDASKVIALNLFEAEQYRAMSVPEEKIAIIPNGIDLSEYANLPPKGSFKSKHNIPGDKKIILYLGRIHRIKGIDLLIKAYANLVKKTGCKDAILVIAGPDDGYLNEAKALVKSLNIDNSVMFTGPLYGRDKLEAYVDADVYVLPSRYEIWGITVLEAIACGTPVVLTENCGIAEYMRNKVALAVRFNLRELAKALFETLYNTELINAFKVNKKVIEEFDISKIVLMLEEVYKSSTV